MSTTTIRLEGDLKARVAAAAELGGTTAHAFILSAIEQTVEEAELEGEWHRIADQRWAKLLDTGKTVSWNEVKAYATARARGERPRKPEARQLKR